MPSMILTPIQRRILDVAEAAGDGRDIAFTHSLLAQVSMPLKSVKGDVYERQAGAASMLLQAGHLYLDGKWEKQPLPYGVSPRLALSFINTSALRSGEPLVELGDSLWQFMGDLDLTRDARAVRHFRRQLQSIAASTMRLGYGRNTTVKGVEPIRAIDLWPEPSDGRQRVLWPASVRLSDDYFADLQEHALPLNREALAALRHSAMAVDAYAWLASRLPRIKREAGERISWRALQAQFGGPDDLRNFRRHFLKALHQAVVAYPGARIEQVRGGLLLKPSPTAVPRNQ